MFGLQKFFKQYPLAAAFGAAFALWIYAFRDFIFLYHGLIYDAVSYYQDMSYFWRNLGMGVYPLWNPFFAEGVPNEFFLRRIGSFNPFLLLSMVFYKLGVKQFMCHTFFLSIYYFVGMIGFYLLAKLLFNDRKTAFTAFLLLYFSALATRLFDSYMVFPTIPMIWFFYFLCAFSVKPQRSHCLGMLLCLMFIFTTYIPFYFVTIFLAFAVCYVVIYPDRLKGVWGRTVTFTQKNKLFVVLCSAVFVVSLLPGIMLYRDANQGSFVMPVRHSTLTSPNAIEVDRHWVDWWAILEDLFFSSHFLRELSEYEFAIVYIPLFGCLVFICSLLTSINRRLAFLFAWGLLIFLIGTPHTPVNQFLSTKVFYFKYFRNLHFFLWMHLLPVGILIITEQFRNLLVWLDERRSRMNGVLLALICAVHAAFLLMLIRQQHEVASSYAVVILSLAFFLIYRLVPRKTFEKFFVWFVLAVVVIQPIEVYGYLRKNVALQPDYQFETPKYYQFLYFEDDGVDEVKAAIKAVGLEYNPGLPSPGDRKIYYGLPWHSFIFSNVNGEIYDSYVDHSLYFYDKVKRVEDKDINTSEVEGIFKNRTNLAYVSADYQEPLYYGDPNTFAPRADVLDVDKPDFKVVRFNMNEVMFETNLAQPKFIVYNDNYDKRWFGFIDQKPLPIYRANVSFKGFWVPAGHHQVYLRYEQIWKYIFNFGMLGMFVIVLACLIISSLKTRGNSE